MEQKVKELLETTFPGIKVDTEFFPRGRTSGSVVWAGFDGLDQVNRQTKIRTLLQKQLGADAQQVGVSLTYTPLEMVEMNAA